jgi:prophage regulatory protein
MNTLLNINGVAQKLQVSTVSIYAWMNASSSRFDASFPVPIRLGKNSVRWVDAELDDWITSRKTRTTALRTSSSEQTHDATTG